jgi:small subunit ribosomal protein S17
VRVRNRKVLTGTVHGDRMEKTVTVNVERRHKHPKYGKYVMQTHRYVVHDPRNEARSGDRVEIAETRPLSKRKRWRLLRVVEQAPRREETST